MHAPIGTLVYVLVFQSVGKKALFVLTKDMLLIVTLCRICLIEEQIPKTVGAPLIHNEQINHNIPEDQHNLGERK